MAASHESDADVQLCHDRVTQTQAHARCNIYAVVVQHDFEKGQKVLKAADFFHMLVHFLCFFDSVSRLIPSRGGCGVQRGVIGILRVPTNRIVKNLAKNPKIAIFHFLENLGSKFSSADALYFASTLFRPWK